MALRKVHLHGSLGEKFGREFNLDVNSPSEAARLLCCNFPEFRRELMSDTAGYYVYVDKEQIDAKQVSQASLSKSEYHFVPVVDGSKDIGKIIIGGALMYFAPGIGQALGGELIAAATIESVAFGIGTNLVVGGVTGLLFAPPKPNKPDEGSEKPSYSFDGPVNTIRQGNCVPFGYGRVRVGSQVISSGFFNTRI